MAASKAIPPLSCNPRRQAASGADLLVRFAPVRACLGRALAHSAQRLWALEDHGRAEVLAKVGVEPTGDAFNSISLDPVTGCPRNPMINAGAIASTGLVEAFTTEGRFRRIPEMFGRYAGRELHIDAQVYASESATGHRNRAIG